MKQMCFSLIVLFLMLFLFLGIGDNSILLAGIPTNGLVAYYPFNGNANDESGNGNNGTVNGASLTTDRFGKPLNAYSFNGGGNNISCGNGSTLQISGNITVCAWAKLQPTSHGQVVINKYYLSADRGWLIETSTSGIVQFNVRSGGGTFFTSGGNYSIFDNSWHFLVGQRVGDVIKIYVDGNLRGQNDTNHSGSISGSVDLRIGVQSDRPTDPATFANGLIDDVFIYNRAISESEISELYHYVPISLARIEVIPSEVSLQAGIQQQFTATGYDNHGNPMTINPTWTATGGTISSTGLFSATVVGDYNVMASDLDKADTAMVHLIPGELASLEVTPASVSLKAGQQQQFTVKGFDAYHNEVVITPHWTATGGTMSATGLYVAEKAGNQTINVSVSGSPVNGTATALVTPGALTQIIVMPDKVNLSPGEKQQFSAKGFDAYKNNVTINPDWSTNGGEITKGGNYTATILGNFTVMATEKGSTIKGTASVSVSGGLAAYYPFTGNAGDSSGNSNHGTVHGATLAPDRWGIDSKAYAFNGNGDYITGGNGSSLQISHDMTICLWAKLQPTTHGQVLVNKYLRTSDKGWLIETQADGKVCFNVRAGAGELRTSGGDFNIFDNKWHFIMGQRHQDTLKIYVDGKLRGQNKTDASGDMAADVDLVIGVQSDRPTDPAAFCNGIIDDIRIYNFVIPDSEIQNLYSDRFIDTAVDGEYETVMQFELSQNYPNPFNPSTSIKISLPQANHVKLAVYNMLGEEVRLLLDEEKPSGMYEINWDGKNSQGVSVPSGVYFYSLSAGNFQEIRKMILAK